jgi:hypothetical protein
MVAIGGGSLRITARQPFENEGLFQGVRHVAEFAKHEVLMVLLREDLWAGLSLAVKTMQLATLAGDIPAECN